MPLPRRSWFGRNVRTIDASTRLARSYVWWQAPEISLRGPLKLLCEILRCGRSQPGSCQKLPYPLPLTETPDLR